MRNILMAVLFLGMGCKEAEQKKMDLPISEGPKKDNLNEAEQAKEWLKKSIVDYFKADITGQEKIMQNITTRPYYQYKTEATNVDMDTEGSLTLKEFQHKWEHTFNPKYAGINTGFLISAQDWTTIAVKKCDLDAISGDSAFVFDVVLEDTGTKDHFNRKIGVVKKNNAFLIADVIEKP